MWSDQVIAYCERTDLSFWAEPVNAVTNAAFVIAAAVMWPRVAGRPMGQALCVVLAVIGAGSFLWHTHATRWAGLMDVLPILGFILLYLFAATRDFLRLGTGLSLLAVALFLPYAFVVGWALGRIVPGLGANAAYISVALLIAIYALVLRGAVGRSLLIGAGLLALSLAFRMADAAVCDIVPIGTHFMWHLLNALMLGWMIETWRRHAPLRA